MDSSANKDTSDDGHDILGLLQKKTEEVSHTFDLLPGELKMDGLDILQGLVTATVRKITMGKVSSVRFIPVQKEKKTSSPSRTNCQENTAENSDIKEEPNDNGDGEYIRPDIIHDADGPECITLLQNGSEDKSSQDMAARPSPPHQSPSQPASPGNPEPPENPATPRNASSPGSADTPGSPAVGSESESRVNELDEELSASPLVDHVKTEEEEPPATLPALQEPVAAEPGGASPRVSGRRAAVAAAARLRAHAGKDGPGHDASRLGVETGTAAVNQRPPDTAPGDDPKERSDDDADEATPGGATKKQYKCRYCTYTTNAKGKLRGHHDIVHSGARLYECEFCGQRFSATSSLKRHKLTHSGEKEHECPVCEKRFYQENQLQVHSFVHTGERLYSCKKCSKKYTNSANLRRHNRIHTGEKPYACAECDARYRDYSSLKLHKLKHTGEKPYTCQVCSKQFKTSSDYRRHERTHTGERRYECTVCGKLFVQGWHLVQHARIHTNERPWSCEQCQKRFRTKASLQFHTRSHLGIKDYTCATCHKAFSTKKYLQLHQVVHTAARPYVCATCGAAFNQYPNMRRHQRVHSDERRYACAVCGKTFKYSNSLQYHEGIHRGERSLCSHCGLSFRSKSGLQHHHCDPSMYSENLRKTVGAMKLVVRIERLDPLSFHSPGSPTVKLSSDVRKHEKGNGNSATAERVKQSFSWHPRIVLKIPKKKLKKRSVLRRFQIVASSTDAIGGPVAEQHATHTAVSEVKSSARQQNKGRDGVKRLRPQKAACPPAEHHEAERRVVPPLRISTSSGSPEAPPLPIRLVRVASTSPLSSSAQEGGGSATRDAGGGRKAPTAGPPGGGTGTEQIARPADARSDRPSDVDVMKAAYV